VTRSASVQFRGREVQNPVLRVLIVLFLAILVPVSMLWVLIIVALLIVLSPVLLPAHFVLRALGRKGFVRRDGDTISIIIDNTALERHIAR